MSAAQPCPHCGGFHPESTRFCPDTGQLIAPAAQLCPFCDADLSPGLENCPNCGTYLGGSEPDLIARPVEPALEQEVGPAASHTKPSTLATAPDAGAEPLRVSSPLSSIRSTAKPSLQEDAARQAPVSSPAILTLSRPTNQAIVLLSAGVCVMCCLMSVFIYTIVIRPWIVVQSKTPTAAVFSTSNPTPAESAQSIVPFATPTELPSKTLAPTRSPTMMPAPTRTARPTRTPTSTMTPTALVESWEACPDSYPSRLHVGDHGKIGYDPPLANRLREGPGLDRPLVGKIEPGVELEVLEGPECANHWVWWYVRSLETGASGWTAEGDLDNYWIVPIRDEQ